jgi:hypothetical protein
MSAGLLVTAGKSSCKHAPSPIVSESSTPHASPSTVASPLFCLVSLGWKEKKRKERKTRAVDRQPSTTVGWPRGARHPVSPRHLHCLSADEVSRPLGLHNQTGHHSCQACSTRIACFALLSFWMSFSRLPASLQSAECSTVLTMPSYVDVEGARLCNHVVSRHIAR